jgi:hypothetical protein
MLLSCLESGLGDSVREESGVNSGLEAMRELQWVVHLKIYIKRELKRHERFLPVTDSNLETISVNILKDLQISRRSI